MNILDGIIIFVITLLIILAIRSIMKSRGCNDCQHCKIKGGCKNGQTFTDYRKNQTKSND